MKIIESDLFLAIMGIVLIIFGCLFLFIGYILTLTLIGAIIGIPLLIIGFLFFITGGRCFYIILFRETKSKKKKVK